MMTKMAEVTLSVAFRKQDRNGEFFGGPMHYMRQGLGKTGLILAGVYAAALFVEVCADACFVQVNTLAVCVNDVYGEAIRSGLGSFGESADMAVGFIVIPNMIALLALSPKFFKLFKEYKAQ